MSLSLCRVVLVEPHYAGNLGATARVMRNMGVADLVLVRPVADPHEREALQMSTHGEAILRGARVVATLEDAVGDCVHVVGTSANSGGLFRRQSVGGPEEVLPAVVDVLDLDPLLDPPPPPRAEPAPPGVVVTALDDDPAPPLRSVSAPATIPPAVE